MDDDTLLQDMEECTDRTIAINIAILRAQEYIDSIKSSPNIKSEVKTSEINKNITPKSGQLKGVGAKPQFPNVIKQTTTSYTTDNNTPKSSGLSSVKNNLRKEERPPPDVSSINTITDKT